MTKKNNNKKISNQNNKHKILIVHGIGNRNPGDTLNKLGNPLADTLERITNQDFKKSNHSYPNKLILNSKSKNSNIEIEEVYWNDDFVKRSKNKVRWLILRIPLILLTILFDYRDRKIFKYLLEGGFHLKDLPQYTLSLLRLFYRALLLSIVPFLLLIIINSIFTLALSITIWFLLIIPLTLLFIYILLGTKLNLAEQVRMASSIDKPEFISTIKKIKLAIENSAKEYSTVSVVAHSQGGYLTYHAIDELSAKYRKKINIFIGVGSGLVPITIISRTSDKKNIFYMWMVFIASIVYACFFYITVGYTLTDWSIKSINYLNVLGNKILLNYPSEVLEYSMLDVNKSGLQDYSIASKIFIMLILIPLVLWIIKATPNDFKINNLNVKWVEISSFHDVVGRLSFYPENVLFIPAGIFGNFIKVHLGYFRKDNPSIYIITSKILKNLGIRCKDFDSINRLFLNEKGRRRRLSNISMGIASIALSATVGLNSGKYILLVLPIALMMLIVIKSLLAYLVNRLYRHKHNEKLIEDYLNDRIKVYNGKTNHTFRILGLISLFVSLACLTNAITIFGAITEVAKTIDKHNSPPAFVFQFIYMSNMFSVTLILFTYSLFVFCNYKIKKGSLIALVVLIFIFYYLPFSSLFLQNLGTLWKHTDFWYVSISLIFFLFAYWKRETIHNEYFSRKENN